MGLIFDTDVDRMSAVLPSGEEINRNALIAMMAAILAPDYPGSTIITDSVTSDELTTFLEDELHLVHHATCGAIRTSSTNASASIKPVRIAPGH